MTITRCGEYGRGGEARDGEEMRARGEKIIK